MNFVRRIFKRKEFKPQPKQLRMDGVKTEMTAEPDDAELAAQALLESMTDGGSKPQKSDKESMPKSDHPHDADYYRRIADHIRQAHEVSRTRALRFVAFCEQELKKKDLPMTGPGSLGLLERELYKRIDTVEREGGDLLQRWQHCLAEVIVRQNKASGEGDDSRPSEDV